MAEVKAQAAKRAASGGGLEVGHGRGTIDNTIGFAGSGPRSSTPSRQLESRRFTLCSRGIYAVVAFMQSWWGDFAAWPGDYYSVATKL